MLLWRASRAYGRPERQALQEHNSLEFWLNWTYDRRATADRLRQEILEQKGWRLYRIWSTDWFNDPEREAKKLLSHLHALTGSPWAG